MTLNEWVKENWVGAVLVPILLALVASAYTVGLKQGENNAKEVEEFRKTLPDMMENLQKLSGDLAKSVEMSEENKRLKEANAAFDAKQSELEKKNQQLAVSLKEKGAALADALAKFDALFPTQSTVVTIEQHSAPEIFPRLLRIGVNDISPYLDSVDVTANGIAYHRLNLNVPQEIPVPDGSCRVTLTKIGIRDAEFDASCTVKPR